jgi:hypothetical protein
MQCRIQAFSGQLINDVLSDPATVGQPFLADHQGMKQRTGQWNLSGKNA